VKRAAPPGKGGAAGAQNQNSTVIESSRYPAAPQDARLDPAADLPYAIARTLVLALLVGAAVGGALALAACGWACAP
jgi:hypothetical protein